jgi:2-polyprenyl-6-methoxyphenol hydroxylase-like FAD-dependent oxidoreductase
VGIVGKSAALAFSQKGIKVLHIAADFDGKSSPQAIDTAHLAWSSRVYAISEKYGATIQRIYKFGMQSQAKENNV